MKEEPSSLSLFVVKRFQPEDWVVRAKLLKLRIPHGSHEMRTLKSSVHGYTATAKGLVLFSTHSDYHSSGYFESFFLPIELMLDSEPLSRSN